MTEINFFAFLLAITLLTLTPGVDTLITLRNSVRGGWREGVVTSFGICSGLFVHAVVSALGISLILLQSAYAFTVLKWLGACYLIWLGANSLWSALKGQGLVTGNALVFSNQNPGLYHYKRALREGFLSNVLNPKTALFYMAFLPQFIDPQGSALWQSLMLAAIHFVIAMAWQSLLAVGVNRSRHWLEQPVFNRVFHSLTGMVLIALGGRLAASD